MVEPGNRDAVDFTEYEGFLPYLRQVIFQFRFCDRCSQGGTLTPNSYGGKFEGLGMLQGLCSSCYVKHLIVRGMSTCLYMQLFCNLNGKNELAVETILLEWKNKGFINDAEYKKFSEFRRDYYDLTMLNARYTVYLILHKIRISFLLSERKRLFGTDTKPVEGMSAGDRAAARLIGSKIWKWASQYNNWLKRHEPGMAGAIEDVDESSDDQPDDGFDSDVTAINWGDEQPHII